MIYHWQVYNVFFQDTLCGYVFAETSEDAENAWKAHLVKGKSLPADRFEVMEDAEFYLTSQEEGGHIIFLHPDELVDHVIEADHVFEPYVIWSGCALK